MKSMKDGKGFGEKEEEPLPRYRENFYRRQMGLPPDNRSDYEILKNAFHLAISQLESNKAETYLILEKVKALEHFLVMEHGISDLDAVYRKYCSK